MKRVPTAEQIENKCLPREFIVDELVEKRHFRFLARKLGVYLLHFTVYLLVIGMQRDVRNGFKLHVAVRETMTQASSSSDTNFQDIATMSNYWNWLEKTLVPAVYQSKWYNGDDLEYDMGHTIRLQTKIVGGFRLLQTRRAATNASSMCYNSTFSSLIPVCLSANEYESTEPFGNISLQNRTMLDMFNYTEDESGIEGFKTDFGWSTSRGKDEIAKLESIKKHRWLDGYTKTVDVDLTLYNHNLKLWTCVRYRIEFDLAGGIKPTELTRILNMQPYNLYNGAALVRMVLELIYAATVVYYIVLEFFDIFVLSGGSLYVYFEKYGVYNNLGDIANILVNISIILHWVEFIYHPTRLQVEKATDFSQYIDLVPLAEWETRYMSINTLNVLFQTLRGLKYFQITSGGLRLIRSLLEAGPEIMSFLPIFFTVLAGYTFAGHFLYGLTTKDWSTWDGAFFRVYEMNFGLYDPNEIYDSGGAVSAVFIYSGTILICIVLLNIFLAIVMTTWDALSDEAKELEIREDLKVPTMKFKSIMKIATMSEDTMDDIILYAKQMDCNFYSEADFIDHYKAVGIGLELDAVYQAASWFWIPTIQRKRMFTLKSMKVVSQAYETTKAEVKNIKLAKPTTSSVAKESSQQETPDTDDVQPIKSINLHD